jgi:hypothetical protein
LEGANGAITSFGCLAMSHEVYGSCASFQLSNISIHLGFPREDARWIRSFLDEVDLISADMASIESWKRALDGYLEKMSYHSFTMCMIASIIVQP